MRIASSGVNNVSTVPCTSRVGTRIWSISSPGPRAVNHSRSSSLSVPVAVPDSWAVRVWASTVPLDAALTSTPAQPVLTVSARKSAVVSEFQAIPGTMASTRQSMPARVSWMPPP